MALGTPVAGAAAYSAASGTSVAPAYPAGILTTDVVLLFVGQKPSTANGGTVTTPTGWTLRDELLAAGGYGTTIGADVGNTNLRVYSWDSPVAGQTGTLSITLAANSVSWAFIVRIPTGGGSISYGTADGQRTTTPTSPMSIALTNGATATDFAAGDKAIWAMCIPTDVQTPSQFSAQSITATGATFATATELNEPDSGNGNDIGGYSAYAHVDSGSSTTAPTVTSTLTGTLTNVRGPVVLLRVRETIVPVTHPTTGTLEGQIGSVAGTAQHNIPHPTSGVLAGQDGVIVGAADHEAAAVPHTTTGALTGPGSTLDGSAARFRAFSTSGVLAGQTATITGDADREAQVIPHTTTGALTGPGSTVIGSARHQSLHVTTGTLAGSVATLAGAASRLRAFDSSGTLTGQGAVVEGDADHEPQSLAHIASGALVGDGAEMGGDAERSGSEQPTGGGPGNAQKGKRKGWANERRQFELSQQVQEAKQTLAKSEVKAARRLAAKLEDYTLEIVDFKKLQYEFAKLEAQYNNSEQMAADMREASQAVKQFLQDEQDAIDLLILSEDFDARCVISSITRTW